MSIDDTQYNLEAERKARQQEFENDLNEIFEELFDRVFHEDDVSIFKSFIEKWSPK